MTDEAAKTVRAYHERSKHHPRRYAAGPGRLDWATQPDPFRRFAGAELVELPFVADGVPTSYDELWRPGAVAPRPLTLDTLAAFLELSLGLAAWKEIGTQRWALRANPSSGNLHPTEGYVAAAGIPGLTPGVYHYAPHEHGLERRCAFGGEAPAGAGFLVGLADVHWRET